MSADDDYDEFEDEDGDGREADSSASAAGAGEGEAGVSGLRAWLNRRRGWLLIIGLGIAQALFATILMFLRSGARPAPDMEAKAIRALAVEMLGHEVAVRQVHQLISMRGGKRMTVGVDIVLVLGQLPEERVEGAPRPTEEEFALFVDAVQAMEPRIRSRVNQLLLKIPVEEYGSVEVYVTIKNDVRDFVNDSLDGLDFGEGVRKGIGKRRVTEVLLPMFVRQMRR